jgi:hypothetical protein
MSKNKLVSVLAVAVLSVSAVTVAFAQDSSVGYADTPDYGTVMIIHDGRLNEFDVAAPVAVYNTYQSVTNSDGTIQEVPNGIELLAIDQTTNEGKLVLSADLAALQQLIGGAVASIDANGYSLHYSAGYFWVTAPADAEGKIYSFTWENQTFFNG